jgi:hypothetical protein
MQRPLKCANRALSAVHLLPYQPHRANHEETGKNGINPRQRAPREDGEDRPKRHADGTNRFLHLTRADSVGTAACVERVFGGSMRTIKVVELLFWEWPADNRVGNQHVKFFLASYAVDGLVVHRTSSQSYKDMNNLFLSAMRAVNRNF